MGKPEALAKKQMGRKPKLKATKNQTQHLAEARKKAAVKLTEQGVNSIIPQEAAITDATRLRLLSWQELTAAARDVHRPYVGKVQFQCQDGIGLLTRWTKSVGACCLLLAVAC